MELQRFLPFNTYAQKNKAAIFIPQKFIRDTGRKTQLIIGFNLPFSLQEISMDKEISNKKLKIINKTNPINTIKLFPKDGEYTILKLPMEFHNLTIYWSVRNCQNIFLI